MSNQHTAAVLFTINLIAIARFYEKVIGMRVHKAEGDHIVLEKSGFPLIVHRIFVKDIVIFGSTPG